MYPQLQTSVGLAFIRLPEGEEVSLLFMFDLAAIAKHHLLSVEQGDNESLPFSFYSNSLLEWAQLPFMVHV